MNQKSAKLIRKFIKKGNSDLGEEDVNKLIKEAYQRYYKMTSKERVEFKNRIK